MKLKVEKNEKENDTGVKTLDNILAQIQNKHGKDCIRKLGDSSIIKINTIKTGSMALDNATKINGLPRGRIVEIYGREMSGKTCLSLSAIAQAQKLGLNCAFIDAEYALSTDMAEGIGVVLDDLILVQPDYGEHALEITLALVESGIFGIIVVDSVAALIPKAELDGTMEDQQMGIQARMLGKGLRKLTNVISKTNTCVIFINQIRDTIGGFGYGPKTTTPGGKALKFFSSMRLEVKPIGQIKKGDEVIGNKLKIQVTKNKLAAPCRIAETELYFGKGFSRSSEILDLTVAKDIIKKDKMTFSYNGDRLGIGKAAVRDLLDSDEKLYNKIMKDLDKCQE